MRKYVLKLKFSLTFLILTLVVHFSSSESRGRPERTNVIMGPLRQSQSESEFPITPETEANPDGRNIRIKRQRYDEEGVLTENIPITIALSKGFETQLNSEVPDLSEEDITYSTIVRKKWIDS